MNEKLKGVLIATGVVAVLGSGGAAIAGAAGEKDDDASDRPIAGSALDKASAAAIDHTGGGKVTETEVGDEEGAYEVEVTRGDGSQVDVHLNRGFEVLGAEGDDDNGSGERDDQGDD